ncbi:MAG: IS5 family transposase, partial [Hyphomonadaceae bacterium]|nr:IS5 family transposase [Hyphomonadaceae bacterium]
IWTFREHLKKAGVMDDLFAAFGRQIMASGYQAAHGQVVDASLISAPKQRLTQSEKARIKAGKSASDIWDNPNKASQKDTSARWTIKYSKKKEHAPKGCVDIAIPHYGYKSHIMIDKSRRFIRSFKVTDASCHDGAQLEDLVRTDIPAKEVWADTAYRSNRNEAWLSRHGLVSHIHCKKPRGQPMPTHVKRANSARSRIRAIVEHPFADQKHRMGLKVRTIGLARATIKIGMANMAYNLQRLIYHETQRMKCA